MGNRGVIEAPSVFKNVRQIEITIPDMVDCRMIRPHMHISFEADPQVSAAVSFVESIKINEEEIFLPRLISHDTMAIPASERQDWGKLIMYSTLGGIFRYLC